MTTRELTLKEKDLFNEIRAIGHGRMEIVIVDHQPDQIVIIKESKRLGEVKTMT
jgi:hypothetical protein